MEVPSVTSNPNLEIGAQLTFGRSSIGLNYAPPASSSEKTVQDVVQNWRTTLYELQTTFSTTFTQLKTGCEVNLKEVNAKIQEQTRRFQKITVDAASLKEKMRQGLCGLQYGNKVKWGLTVLDGTTWMATIATPIIQSVSDSNTEDAAWKIATVALGVGSTALAAIAAFAWKLNEKAKKKHEVLTQLDEQEVQKLRQIIQFFEHGQQLQESTEKESETKHQFQNCFKTIKSISSDALPLKDPDKFTVVANLLPKNSSLHQTLIKLQIHGMRRASILQPDIFEKNDSERSNNPRIPNKSASFESGGKKMTPSPSVESDPEWMKLWQEVDDWVGSDEPLVQAIAVNNIEITRGLSERVFLN